MRGPAPRQRPCRQTGLAAACPCCPEQHPRGQAQAAHPWLGTAHSKAGLAFCGQSPHGRSLRGDKGDVWAEWGQAVCGLRSEANPAELGLDLPQD